MPTIDIAKKIFCARGTLKEALNIAVLTFGITFRWKLSKLIQSPFFKDILNKI